MELWITAIIIAVIAVAIRIISQFLFALIAKVFMFFSF
jgi:hypothetical protein